MTGATQRSERWETMARVVPMMRWLPEYRRSRLRGDLLAGAVVAALLVPQSLGYARIAGVPVQVGLYAVPLALLAYAVLGSSPQLIVGPASTVAIVSGSLVADIARDNPQDAVAITLRSGDRCRDRPRGDRSVAGRVAGRVLVEADRDGLRLRSDGDDHHRRTARRCWAFPSRPAT